MRALIIVGIGVLQLGAWVSSHQDDVGVAVVRSMHDRYADKWYRTLTFRQKTTRHAKDGSTSVETWYETARVPGELRIDKGALANANGMLMTADSTFVVEHGVVSRRTAGGNPLMTLLFDVYVVPVEQSVAALRGAGYDLLKVHHERWHGRLAIVVGADSGDLKSSQFWVDVDRLVVVRMLGPTRPGASAVLDAHLDDYRRLGGGWIAPVCEFYVDGSLIQREEYTDIKGDPAVDPALFDLQQWRTAKHWAAP